MEQMLNSIHRRLITFRNDPAKMAREVLHLKKMHEKKYDKFSQPILQKFRAYAAYANKAYAVARLMNSPESNLKYEDGDFPSHTVTGLSVIEYRTLINDFHWADNVRDKENIR